MNGMRSRLGKSTLAVVVIVCAVVFLVFGLVGSVGLVFTNGIQKLVGADWSAFRIGVGKDYTVDDALSHSLDGVEKIVISSVSTDPQIRSGGTELVSSLTGTCRSFTDPVKLKVEKSGSTLSVSIHYPVGLGITSENLVYAITIPATYAGALEIDSISAAARVEDPAFHLGSFRASTVSGDITVSGISATTYDLNTTSGTIEVHDATGAVKANSVSGDLKAWMTGSGDFTGDSVSGTATLTLASVADFDVSFHTVSGSLRCDFAVVLDKDTRTDMSGKVGAGGPSYKVNTVSGDFRIQQG